MQVFLFLSPSRDGKECICQINGCKSGIWSSVAFVVVLSCIRINQFFIGARLVSTLLSESPALKQHLCSQLWHQGITTSRPLRDNGALLTNDVILTLANGASCRSSCRMWPSGWVSHLMYLWSQLLWAFWFLHLMSPTAFLTFLFFIL